MARLAGALPEVTEGVRRGGRSWSVRGSAFAWERPFTGADLRRFAEEEPPREPPSGPLLGVAVDDLGEKEAVLAAGEPGVFTIPHFDGHAALLVQLDVVPEDVLRARLEDAWAAKAPRGLRG